MRLIKKPQVDGNERLEALARDVENHILDFVDLISDLQEEVAKTFIEEYGVQGAIEMNSLSKMARIMSKYAASDNFQLLRKFPKNVHNHFILWQNFRKEALQCDKEQRKRSYAIIPAKLSFYYLYNGELCKGVVCLLDYVEMMPHDHLAMEIAIRWLLFLGETELAEKKMETWKADKNSEEFFTAAKFAIMYIKLKEQRKDALTKLIEIRDKIKKENIRSFQKYELASFVYWVCSTLSNVPASSVLEGCEFPDRLSQLFEAAQKSDSIIRNRVPGLSTYQFNNSVSPSIRTFLEGKQKNSATEYIHLGSAIAWHFEVRREWSLVTISTAQGRDAMTSMILNLRTALKSASLFRIMQSTNIISYYTMMIEEEESRNNAKIMRASILNLISTDPIIVHCSTPVKSKTPSRAQTPLPGQNSSFGADKCSDTLMQDVTDRLADLEIINEQSFHEISRTCGCNICVQYPISSTFASEYMFAYCVSCDFSQSAIQHFNAEFVGIRERDMPCQGLMHQDKAVRPRPNIIQNEVFGLCVVQWLIRKIDRNEPVDAESLEVYKNASKITKYLQFRTMDLSLAITQLGRQLEFPQTCNYSWMRPVIRKPLVKAGIDCAVDILRAVSPFGRSSKTTVTENQGVVTSPRFEAMRLEMRNEMTRYGHILYRDWRCRLYPYVGRTSDNAWEAAYAWAESTSIGVRNAVQFKIEKCRKGLVTISGFERFKKCVEAMPDDMTLVHLAMADNKQIYLIKLHADREPIVMPLAHSSQAMELMEKFTFLLQEDEKIAKFPGPLTPEEFWKKRKIVDARMMTFVDEVQKNFFDVSASLLMPTDRLGPVAKETAVKIQKLSKQGIRLGEAKEMVYLSEHMDVKSWEKLGLRFCEMRNKDSGFLDILPGLHRSCLEAMKKDRKTGKPKPSKKYTYLVICPQLSQFCWERLPIFDGFPYVARQVSIHATFSQLEAMRNQEKKIPLQIDVQNAYYVLDPENNLGDTKRRMLDYINKFNWQGTVGAAPDTKAIANALTDSDAFFYFGHGSGSAVIPRSVIKQATCNAIIMLMGCGSVRTIPQAYGFDGKSALLDYAIAKCPLIVGCLWTVTDGEIDRYLMRMVDDCFERTKGVTGIDKLRQLSEAMAEARSKAKLAYLTGAAVVMYGLPVVSKTAGVDKENRMTSPENLKALYDYPGPSALFSTPQNKTNVPKTPPRQMDQALKLPKQSSSTSLSSRRLDPSKRAETIPKTPKEKAPKTPSRVPISQKTQEEATVKIVGVPVPRTPRGTSKNFPSDVDEPELKSTKSVRTRASTRIPSRSRQK